LKNIKVGVKLIASFLIATALTVVMGVYSFIELKRLDDNSRIIYEKATVPIGLLVHTVDVLQEIRLQVREWKLAKTDDARALALKNIEHSKAVLDELIFEQRKRVIHEGGKKFLDNLLANSSKYVTEAYDYAEANTKRMANGATVADIPQSLLNTGEELRKSAVAAVTMRVGAAKEISEENSQMTEKAMKISLIILISAWFISVGLGVYLTLSITSVLNGIVNTVSKIEGGDMTVRSKFKREDEFGMLSKSVDSLASKFQTIMKDLRVDSDGLASSAEELSVISNQLVNIAEESLLQSMTVTSTTEQVSENIKKMAKSAEKSSINSDNVATEMNQVSNNIREIANFTWEAAASVSTATSAARQMSADMNIIVNSIREMKISIGKIADNISETRKMIDEAIVKSDEATKTVGELDTAARDIGNSSKTNTIAQRIEGIQASTSEAVAAINKVSGIIIRVNENVGAVFNNVALQILASNEMAKSVEQADTDVRRVSEYVDQMAKNSKEVASSVLKADNSVERVSKSIYEVADSSRNIAHIADIASKGTKLVGYNVTDMNRAAQNSVYGAKQVNRNANELAKIASGLKSVVDQFRV